MRRLSWKIASRLGSTCTLLVVLGASGAPLGCAVAAEGTGEDDDTRDSGGTSNGGGPLTSGGTSGSGSKSGGGSGGLLGSSGGTTGGGGTSSGGGSGSATSGGGTTSGGGSGSTTSGGGGTTSGGGGTTGGGDPQECLVDWNVPVDGTACKSSLQDDWETGCTNLLNCWRDNDCKPTESCTTNPDGVCGQNKVANANAGMSYAVSAYNQLCN